MSNTKVAFFAVAFLACQAAGQLLTGDYYVAEQNQFELNRPVIWDAQLPAVLDPYGCTRPGGLPLALDPLRRCSTYYRGARLPVAIDPLGCSRPGGIPAVEDPLRACSTYLNGSPYPIGVDRLGLAGALVNGGVVGTGVAPGVVANQPGTLTQTPQLPQLTNIGSASAAMPSIPGMPSVPSVPSAPSVPSL